MLLLYDKDGQIVYQEILGDACLGITALQVPRRRAIADRMYKHNLGVFAPQVRVQNAEHPKEARTGT